jgi:soluble lytic murein transglycosylase-like protein
MINIEKIIKIESSGNPNAVNEKSGARGLCQITEIALQHHNQVLGTNYTKEELFNPDINCNIANSFVNLLIPRMLKSMGIINCDMTRLIAYNWGVGNLKKWYEQLPAETRQYLKKYEEM